jgi:hypothetical protein
VPGKFESDIVTLLVRQATALASRETGDFSV